MSEHDFKYPWSVMAGSKTIVNADGIPVAFTTGYTSIKQRYPDGVKYNNTDTAGEIRVERVALCMNALADFTDEEIRQHMKEWKDKEG